MGFGAVYYCRVGRSARPAWGRGELPLSAPCLYALVSRKPIVYYVGKDCKSYFSMIWLDRKRGSRTQGDIIFDIGIGINLTLTLFCEKPTKIWGQKAHTMGFSQHFQDMLWFCFHCYFPSFIIKVWFFKAYPKQVEIFTRRSLSRLFYAPVKIRKKSFFEIRDFYRQNRFLKK